MKKTKFAATLSLALLAGAPATMNAEDCCMPEYMPGEVICNGCPGYTQFAGVELDCGWDVFARGEFLYWRPYRSVARVAIAVPQNTSTQPQLELNQSFGFRPGFSVGLGMVAHCFDDWTFNLDYTRYHHSFNKTFSETAPTTLFSTLLIFPTLACSSIRNKSHFHYDIVGLYLQRPNYLGQRVILSPSLGIKWLKRNNLISQDLIDAGNGSLNHGETTFKYTSIGLSAGFDGSWLFCWGFSLIGKADVALLYPYERSVLQRTIPSPVNVNFFNPVVRAKHHIRHLDIYARGGFGIGWGSYFCCKRYHVNLAATYDFMGDVAKLDVMSGNSGNPSVVLMGLTIRGQFDF